MKKITTKDSVIRFSEQVVINGDDEYRFYSDINNQKEKLYGLLLSDYRTCGEYRLNRDLRFILDTHMRSEL